MVTMREIQTFITNISYKVFKKLLHYSCCNKTTNHSRQTSSNTQKLHLHLYIQEVTVHVTHKAASVLQTCLRKSERPKGLKTLITTQTGGGEATSLV